MSVHRWLIIRGYAVPTQTSRVACSAPPSFASVWFNTRCPRAFFFFLQFSLPPNTSNKTNCRCYISLVCCGCGRIYLGAMRTAGIPSRVSTAIFPVLSGWLRTHHDPVLDNQLQKMDETCLICAEFLWSVIA